MQAIRLALLAPLACGASLIFTHDADAGSRGSSSGLTILETAKQVGGFELLLSSVRSTGLAQPLQSDGPLTVFAPVNQAFLDLGRQTLDALGNDPQQLASILTYHVVAGEFDAATLQGLDFLTTLNGQRLDLEFDGTDLFVDGVAVALADVGASNGVIHVIGSVLLPVQDTIPEVADSVGIFNTLLAAVDAADLENALQRPGPYTVFAPTDEAFGAIDPAVLNSLLQPENQDALFNILAYHLVPNAGVYADQAVLAGSATTAQGQSVTITDQGGTVFIDDAEVILPDVEASNGVIHVINAVLMP